MRNWKRIAYEIGLVLLTVAMFFTVIYLSFMELAK
jgi:hypothetical protein